MRPRQGPPPPRTPIKGSFGKETARDKLHQEAIDFARNFSIPESIAFQIVRGDFTLKDWLERHAEAERKRGERNKVMAAKKVQRSRDEGMAQQYFLKQKKNATRIIFHMAEERVREGIVKSILPYHLWLEDPPSNEEPGREKVEKLHILYCYKVENAAEVRSVTTVDEEVKNMGLGPVRDKSARYQAPLDIVEQAAMEQRAIHVILYDGTVFEGRIDWFSNYFIKLKVSPGASVVIFNHALHEVTSVTPVGAR